jgi:hypothetical protein
LLLDKAIYKVKHVSQENIYYRYPNRIELQPEFTMSQEKWSQWISSNGKAWVAPKTKMLWITSNYSADKELLFDKNLFSLYTEEPQNISYQSLKRLSPRIVILDKLEGDIEIEFSKWVDAHLVDERPLIIENQRGLTSGRKAILCFQDNELNPELLAELRGFLKHRIISSNIDAKFISRNSEFSKAKVHFEAELTEISQKYFSFISPLELHKTAIIQFKIKANQVAVHFGHVVHSEFIEAKKQYQIYCEWIPSTSNLEDIFPSYEDLILK